jgi:proteasome activator subunit 4
MSELNDSSDLQIYSSAVLYVLSAIAVPEVYVQVILDNYVSAIKSSTVGHFFFRILCVTKVYSA